ncbi:MAG: HD domain-containing protein [Candidatus Hadarchaeota archaeon]
MFVKYVRDPVFGYIGITDVERNIIDTRAVQRMRRIKQLSISSAVYPGAVHSRFSHAIGVMHIAGRMMDSLGEYVEVNEEDWQLMRLAGLLHDVGHGPFSHTYEGILSEKLDLTHEDMGRRVLEESNLSDKISSQGYNSSELAELIFGEPETEKFLKHIITSQFDADKMDFLLRDSYFSGVQYGQVDIQRLIQAMEIIDGNIALDKKALSALEAFMIARYEMFMNVYYHHTVRAADIMLKKAMKNVDEILGLTTFEDIDEFLEMDDAYVINGLRRLNPDDYSGAEKEGAEKAEKIFRDLESRNLIKTAFDRDVHVKDEYVAKLLGDYAVRRGREKEIASRAGVDPEHVTVDVPTLASMPYYPRDIDPAEVPLFEKDVDGKKREVSLSRNSRLVNVLRGYVDLIRVYTPQKYRNKVCKVSEEVFKELPLSAQLSM